MALETYKQKRDFTKSPEPTGGTPADKSLRFVVQKHHASHLHYDFRLELRGILKSWAVPKGPSMNTAETRLAMLVEDHPWDYRDFEGVIPSGYGAGTVIVWDEGTYETHEIKEKDKKAQEHSITSQFWKGQIKFTLYGQKLKGAFRITRAKDKGKNSWYLAKLKDQYALKSDITKKDKSVLSKKTLEQVAADPERTWQSHKPGRQRKENFGAEVNTDILKTIKAGIKKSMPGKVEPMLCTLIKETFNSEAWIYELKLDGYRVVAGMKNNNVTLRSCTGVDYTKFYPPVVECFKQLPYDVVIDGEVVVPDEDGKPNFDLLQQYDGTQPILFYAFDLTWISGYDVTGLDLITRKSLLREILPDNEVIRYTEHFEDGNRLFEMVKEMELEGIVAKRKNSTYQTGKRSKDWLKLPAEIKQEFVIGGWTESEHGSHFRTLLFGAYNKEKLSFIGHARGGYKESALPGILSELKKLEIKHSPFINKVDTDTTVHFVKPKLVAKLKLATWPTGTKIRKPASFLALRDDKDPKDVVKEIPLTSTRQNKIVKEKHQLGGIGKSKQHKSQTDMKGDAEEAYESNWPKLERQEITSKETFTINDKEVVLTNVEKELWKGITKADLIQYYHSISAYIIPHLKDRPQSLHIKPIKANLPGFYIKDMEERQPGWANIFSVQRKHPKQGKPNTIKYLVCDDEAALLYIINLGCIDINPWTSRSSDYLHPDYIIIDLDPGDDDFSKVISTAIAAKEFFDKNKLKAFPKTSGKTGLHIYLPCKGFTFKEARTIALRVCTMISSLVPGISTIENTISKRGNKVFIDYNQNDEGDTVAAPYSVRPANKPTVSAPLEWKEINEKLSPVNFDITNMLERIKKKGDLFKNAMNIKIRISNSRILKKLF